MKPPICCICDTRFYNMENAGLIYFPEDENDKKFNERVKKEHIIAHPPNAFWFCEKHYWIAKNFSNFTKQEALHQIRAKINEIDGVEN